MFEKQIMPDMEISKDKRKSSEARVWTGERERARRRLERNVETPRYYNVGDMDVYGVRPCRNQVLVRVDGFNDSRYGDRGGHVVDMRYDPLRHLDVWVEVISLPGSFGLDRVGDGRVDMEVGGVMDLRVGDRAMVRYLGLSKSLGLGDVKGDKRSFVDNIGRYYAILNYSEFVLRDRSGEIKALNGWVLLGGVDRSGIDGLYALDSGKKSDRFGRVLVVGDRVKYLHDYSPDLGEIGVGDYVSFAEGGDIEVRGLPGHEGKEVYRCPVRHITAKYEIDGKSVDDKFASNNLRKA